MNPFKLEVFFVSPRNQLLTLYVSCICISIFSCGVKPRNKNKIEGIYLNKGNPHLELSFKYGRFLLKDEYSQSKYTQDCCDTISYGYWQKEYGNFISLTSPEKFRSSYVDILVEEKIDSSVNDIKFIIKNGMEDYYDNARSSERYRKYELRINSDYFSKLSEITYDSNIISIDKENLLVNEFEINILIDKKISLNNLGIEYIHAIPYKVKNNKSNLFIIKIPDLHLSFLSHRRLNQDYVKILNDSTLFWDGDFYLKKIITQKN